MAEPKKPTTTAPKPGTTTATEPPKAPEQSLAKTAATQFVKQIEKMFASQMGSKLAFTAEQGRLAQNLFLKIDASLIAAEAKRLAKGDGGTPYTWANVNMLKLAMDSPHRVMVGLDALIPNHISPVFYWNTRLQKYDVDLRIGYVGKDFVHRRLAVDEPVAVRYELVYENDKFRPIFANMHQPFDTYEFEVADNPFNRGKVIGGFGYIERNDPRQNKLVLVTPRDFDKSKNAAGTKDMWNNWDLEMQLKTVVHRTCAKIPIDPAKIGAESFAYIEAQEVENVDNAVQAAIAANANGEVITLTSETPAQTPVATAPAAPANPRPSEPVTPAPSAPVSAPEQVHVTKNTVDSDSEGPTEQDLAAREASRLESKQMGHLYFQDETGLTRSVETGGLVDGEPEPSGQGQIPF